MLALGNAWCRTPVRFIRLQAGFAEGKENKKNDAPSILHLTNLHSLPCDAYLETCITGGYATCDNVWRGMRNGEDGPISVGFPPRPTTPSS